MLKNPDGSLSLSRIVFAGAWAVSLFGAVHQILGGPDVTGLVASLLTPAGVVYAARAHSQGMNTNDPRGGAPC